MSSASCQTRSPEVRRWQQSGRHASTGRVGLRKGNRFCLRSQLENLTKLSHGSLLKHIVTGHKKIVYVKREFSMNLSILGVVTGNRLHRVINCAFLIRTNWMISFHGSMWISEAVYRTKCMYIGLLVSARVHRTELPFLGFSTIYALHACTDV